MSKYKNNNNHKSKRKAKGKLKIILIVIASLLAGVIAFGAISSLLAEKPLNENNLLKYDKYENMIEESEKGLKVKWNEDGSIVLSGKHSDNDIANNAHYSCPFVTVELDPGEYTLSTGNKNCSQDTYGMYIIVDGASTPVYDKPVTFTVSEKTVATVGFTVKNNYYILYGKLSPVLVAEDNAENIYSEVV